MFDQFADVKKKNKFKFTILMIKKGLCPYLDLVYHQPC